MFDPVAYINEPRWHVSRLGLDRMRELLDALGSPQSRLKFVHVAGTNGKGSVCAYLASVLQAAGYRTGLLTSPYVETFAERMRVDGTNISEDDLREITLRVKDVADAMTDHPTEFELMCAVALMFFVDKACDIVVLEVGLGGRLDATNVIEAPEVCVVARIGYDHTALLGTTLAAIAGEKAGIIKLGATVVSWPQESEAMTVIQDAVKQAKGSLVVSDFSQLAQEEFTFPITCSTDSSSKKTAENLSHNAAEEKHPVRTFSYKGFRNLTTTLLGAYQPANASLALDAIGVLRARGWRIPNEAVYRGIVQTRWPGRFEVVEHDPLFIIDGGHNAQGAHALVDTLQETLPHRRIVFIIGVLEDKDYPEMLEAVLPLGSAFITITPPNDRALSAEKLATALRWTAQDMQGCSACIKPHVASTTHDAVVYARQLAYPDGAVVAFGSLYSVGELKQAIGSLHKL